MINEVLKVFKNDVNCAVIQESYWFDLRVPKCGEEAVER